MSRSIDQSDSERLRQENLQSRMTLSQGRGGGSGSGNSEDERREINSGRPGVGGAGFSVAELATLIDKAAADKPSMSQFVERLRERGVAIIPSIQSSGRLNGMSYRFNGGTVKGSSIGREYTAQGLQNRKGVRYEPTRDDSVLQQALGRAGFQRRQPSDVRYEETRNAPDDRHARLRERCSGLSPDQNATLAEIGKFRTLKSEDVIQHRYAGNFGRFQQDIRVFSERRFAERRTVHHAKSGQQYSVVVLTQRGRDYLRRVEKQKPEGEPKQQYHAGFVKPAEVKHDVGIYRMYQAEKAQIRRDGGTVKRVVLDFELKKKVFAELNRDTDRSDPDYAARKREIAEDHGLKSVEGRIVFPDLRIEYETQDHEMDKVDLELATGDYKNSQVQIKHAAGLKIYAPNSAAGSPALQDPEIVVGLISI
ncbi:MAG: Relaxase/mobilization nuclease family protein [Bryobacterales bacterium]|nr:Relaxase/mobilization nuclease family protein [Bryobacterales bacterium]